MILSAIKNVPLPNAVNNDASEGIAKIDGRDIQGRIRVFARRTLEQSFTLVFASERFDVCALCVNQLTRDSRLRSRMIKDAQ